nr:alpha/beta hydrolase [Candidatus Sigynarchaeota archaeon]
MLDDGEISGRIFFPRREPAPVAVPGKMDVLSIPVAAKTAIGGLLFIQKPALPTLLLFHGNGEIATDYMDIAGDYIDCGVNFAVADYRGYGFSDGEPSFTALFQDCIPIYDHLRKVLEKKGCNTAMFVLGRSLGSTCAAEIGSRQVQGLLGIVFESGIGDTFSVMQRLWNLNELGITRELVKPLSNDTRVKKATSPVLVIHGTADYIVPVEQADVLYNSVPDGVYKKKVIIDGAGHNDILMWKDEYFPPLKHFIADCQKKKV